MSNLEIAEVVVVIAMLVGVWLMFRRLDRAKRAHEGSKVAAAAADADHRFALRHTPARSGTYLAYLRYAIEHRGGEDDFGLRCQVEGRRGGEQVFSRDLGILGAIANPPPLEYDEEVQVQCDVTLKTGGIGYQRWATVLLGQFDGCAAGAELDVAGQVTPNALTLIGSLEVYLVPESARL